MPRPKNQVPSYRRKKSRNLAFTTIEGSNIYLGKFGSAASKAEYARVLAEYAATGKVTKPGAIRMMCEQADDDDLAISELLAKYMRFARAYYRKGGKETSEVHSLKTAFRPLRRLYGRLPASQFGPRELKAVRKEMIDAGWIRESINQHVARIRRFFRWCGEEEWVDGSVLANLKTVAALKVDRCDAAEGKEVSPIGMDVFQATLPELVPMLRDMARVQLLTGMRPGEVCHLHADEIDRHADPQGKVWQWEFADHKLKHLGKKHRRVIQIGPEAQKMLAIYLIGGGYCFSAKMGEEQDRQRRHERRKTPIRQGNAPRRCNTRLKGKRGKRRPNDHYSTASYRRAIHRACDRAFPPTEPIEGAALVLWQQEHRWSPNQIRHASATDLAKELGEEQARVVLGHAVVSKEQAMQRPFRMAYLDAQRRRAGIEATGIGS